MAHFIGDTGVIEFTASGKVVETETEPTTEIELHIPQKHRNTHINCKKV